MIGIFEMVAPVITYIYKYKDTYIRDIKGREAIDYSSFMKVLKLWIMSIKERGRGGSTAVPWYEIEKRLRAV